MLLFCKEKANQEQDEKPASCNVKICCLQIFSCLISHQIGHSTIAKVKSKCSQFLDSHNDGYQYGFTLYNHVQGHRQDFSLGGYYQREVCASKWVGLVIKKALNTKITA